MMAVMMVVVTPFFDDSGVWHSKWPFSPSEGRALRRGPSSREPHWGRPRGREPAEVVAEPGVERRGRLAVPAGASRLYLSINLYIYLSNFLSHTLSSFTPRSLSLLSLSLPLFPLCPSSLFPHSFSSPGSLLYSLPTFLPLLSVLLSQSCPRLLPRSPFASHTPVPAFLLQAPPAFLSSPLPLSLPP